jgi:hypothetical protein
MRALARVWADEIPKWRMPMMLEPHDNAQVFRLNQTLMWFVAQRLKLVSEPLPTPSDFMDLPQEKRIQIRQAFLQPVDLAEAFAEENPANLPQDDLEIVRSWRHLIAGRFYILRQLRNYAIFLSMEAPQIAYGVVALSQPLEEVIGPYFPMMMNAVLLPFKGKIIYDGLLSSYNIHFGPGIRRSMEDSFKEAKARHGIVTSLPMSAEPAPPARDTPKPKAKPDPKPHQSADEAAGAAQLVSEMVDQFCRKHLNQEYADLCLRLAEKLARKRPSPLAGGKPNTWACGIVRTIGWVNFLDDRDHKPYMKLTAIDKAFGVAESTGQGKSMLIRKMFKIRSMDPAWTLPSMMDQNPKVWLIQVNGMIVDVRHLSREIQEAAF